MGISIQQRNLLDTGACLRNFTYHRYAHAHAYFRGGPGRALDYALRGKTVFREENGKGTQGMGDVLAYSLQRGKKMPGNTYRCPLPPYVAAFTYTDMAHLYHLYDTVVQGVEEVGYR